MRVKRIVVDQDSDGDWRFKVEHEPSGSHQRFGYDSAAEAAEAAEAAAAAAVWASENGGAGHLGG